MILSNKQNNDSLFAHFPKNISFLIYNMIIWLFQILRNTKCTIKFILYFMDIMNLYLILRRNLQNCIRVLKFLCKSTKRPLKISTKAAPILSIKRNFVIDEVPHFGMKWALDPILLGWSFFVPTLSDGIVSLRSAYLWS